MPASGPTAVCTKALGVKIKCMEMAFLLGQTAENMLENIERIRKKGMESSFNLTSGPTRATGMTGKNTAEECV